MLSPARGVAQLENLGQLKLQLRRIRSEGTVKEAGWDEHGFYVRYQRGGRVGTRWFTLPRAEDKKLARILRAAENGANRVDGATLWDGALKDAIDFAGAAEISDSERSPPLLISAGSAEVPNEHQLAAWAYHLLEQEGAIAPRHTSSHRDFMVALSGARNSDEHALFVVLKNYLFDWSGETNHTAAELSEAVKDEARTLDSVAAWRDFYGDRWAVAFRQRR